MKNVILSSALLMCITTEAFSMEKVDDDFTETYLIKNIKNGEFLFTSSKESEDSVGTRASIAKDSLCVLEKHAEGYVIKTVKYGEYLNVEREIRNGSSYTYVKWKKNLESNSYFKLLRNKREEYVIKNKKCSDYLCLDSYLFCFGLSDSFRDSKNVGTSNTIRDSSYFVFQEYDGNYF